MHVQTGQNLWQTQPAEQGLRCQPCRPHLLRRVLATAQSFWQQLSIAPVPLEKERDAACGSRNSWCQWRDLGIAVRTLSVVSVVDRAAAVTVISGRGFGGGIFAPAAPLTVRSCGTGIPIWPFCLFRPPIWLISSP